MKNKPQIIGACFFFLAMSVFAVSAQETTQSWRRDGFDFKAYNELYIFNIDLRGLHVKEWDSEEEEYDEEQIDNQVLVELANHLYAGFSDKLQKSIPVREGRAIDTSKKALVVDIKLSGELLIDEQRLLQSMFEKMFQTDSQQVALTVQCIFKDGSTGESLVSYSDVQDIVIADIQKPFATDEDINRISKLAAFWANELTIFLKSKEI